MVIQAAAALAAALFTTALPMPAAGPRCIAVVGTNDLHGALEPYTIAAPLPDGAAPGAQAAVRTGGVVGLGGYVQALRRLYGAQMLLLDAGDMFQGTLASNLSEGRAVIEAYNYLGYAAAAVGNHEFDFGAGEAGGSDRLAVLKARIAAAQFPFLTLNIMDRHTGRRVAWPNTQPSVLRQVGGIQVGIVGISTVETPRVTKPQNVTELAFVDPVPLIRDEAARLRRLGAELVVLVGHVGGKCTNLDDPHDPSSCLVRRAEAELVGIIRALPEGTLDVAIGGHTHQFMAHWLGRTATLESGARGHFFGYVEACVAPQGGIDVARSTIYGAQPLCLEVWRDGSCKHRKRALLPVRAASHRGEQVTVDARLQQRVQPYLDAVAARAAHKVGVHLPRPLGVMAIGDLVAEAMRRASNSDFGLQNRGGVRAGLAAGETTFGELYASLPFDNVTVQVTLTGAQIEQLVRRLMRRGPLGAPALAGLRLTQQSGSSRLQLVTSKGEALQPRGLYVLATNDFLVQGGDGTEPVFGMLPPARVRVHGESIRDVFTTLLRNFFPL